MCKKFWFNYSDKTLKKGLAYLLVKRTVSNEWSGLEDYEIKLT